MFTVGSVSTLLGVIVFIRTEINARARLAVKYGAKVGTKLFHVMGYTKKGCD